MSGHWLMRLLIAFRTDCLLAHLIVKIFNNSPIW
jgi:hypothetical protein